MNVLTVEVDKFFVELIRTALCKATDGTNQVVEVDSPREAFERLAEKLFDVVLLDLQCSAQSGFDAVSKLATVYPAIPVVVLTGAENEEFALESLRRGARDYLIREELSANHLLRALRFAVESKRRRLAEQKMLEAQERERKRLSLELHDSVIQSLSSLRLELQTMAADTRCTPRLTSKRLTKIADLALITIDEVRRVSRDLHPAILEMRDLGEALILVGKRVQAESGVVIKVFDRFRGELSWQLKHQLYRIFQEAVRNAVRHAHPKSVTVEFGTRDGKLILEIRDDGRGFDTAAVESSYTGLGLTSIRERAELMNGQAFIHSRAQEGSTIRVEIPAGIDFVPQNVCASDSSIRQADFLNRETTSFSNRDTVCRNRLGDMQDANPRHASR